MAKIRFSSASNQREHTITTENVPNKNQRKDSMADVGIKGVFPPRIQRELEMLGEKGLAELEEIRCRVGKPLVFVTNTQSYGVSVSGELVTDLNSGRLLTKDELELILQKISQCSAYAWEEEFRRGYLTLPHGHRVGLTGRVVLQKGAVKTIKDVSSLNFRIAREIKGAADPVMPYILSFDQRVLNTLLVSPPQCGKTTLLRDIIRQISDGIGELNVEGVNVGLVDERSEVAGSLDGSCQQDVGIRTDVLDGCPKAEGMTMLIRSMAPQVIATDEIGRQEDMEALEEALHAGISVITTVHGRSMEDLQLNPHLNMILKQGLFKRIIFLGRTKGVGTIEQIIDTKRGENILKAPIGGKKSD